MLSATQLTDDESVPIEFIASASGVPNFSGRGDGEELPGFDLSSSETDLLAAQQSGSSLPPLQADFNWNFQVDPGDIANWQGGYATTAGATHDQGDVDSDGDVDGSDFLAWQRSHGKIQYEAFGLLPEALLASNETHLPDGGEFIVNDQSGYSSGYQYAPAAAALAGGETVVVWSGEGPGSGTGIWGQRLAKDGSKVGTVFRIDDPGETVKDDFNPMVASDGDDAFVVVWHDINNSDETQILTQKFRVTTANEPVKVGTQQIVDGLTSGADFNYYPSVAMRSNESFVVSWRGWAGSTNNFDVYVRRYESDAGGLAVATDSSPVTVPSTTSIDYSDRHSIAVDDSGFWALRRQIDISNSSSGGDSKLYVYRANTSTGGGGTISWDANPMLLRDAPGSGGTTIYDASIGSDAHGNLMVVWSESSNTNSTSTVYARYYSGTTTTWETQRQVSSSSKGVLSNVAGDAAGYFAIATYQIETPGTSSTSTGAFLQWYDPTAVDFTEPLLLGTTNVDSSFFTSPGLAVGEAGQVLVAWAAFDSLISPTHSDIYARLFRPILEVSTETDEFDGDYRPGDLSLREALHLAKLLPGDDTIGFDSVVFDTMTPSTILLDHSLGELIVDDVDAVEVVGVGSDYLIIDADRNSAAGQEHRVLRVEPGSDLSLSGATLTGGVPDNDLVDPYSRSGAGILNLGSLYLNKVTVDDNQAGTRGSGGGIYNAGQLEIFSSTISGNTAGENGGGGIFAGGNVTIRYSAIINNTADYIQTWGHGGGIAIGRYANVNIQNTTISGNTAADGGGGVSDGSYGGEGGNGGGSTVSFLNTTIANNTGGGIDLLTDFSPTSTWTFHNTIIADNLSNGAGVDWDLRGDGAAIDPLSSHNILSVDQTGVFAGLASGLMNQPSLTSTQVGLETLADNGGPTLTHALKQNSLAMDAGNDTEAINAMLSFDQRGTGFSRRVRTVDVGAFETTLSPNTPPTIGDQSFNIDENSPNKTTVGTVIASDLEDGSSIIFEITAGNDEGIFAIDNETGKLEVADSDKLDFESVSTHLLTIQVTDTGELSSSAVMTITVNNLNEAPLISDKVFEIDENSPDMTLVGNVEDDPNDPDNVPATTQAISYDIVSGDSNGVFAIDMGTGEISVANSNLLNYEARSTYVLTVRATDDGSPEMSTDARITIDLNDLNEPPEIIDQTFDVDENSPNGTVVGKVGVAFLDAGEVPQYTIVPDSESEPGLFTLDADTGEIVVANGSLLDFESGASSYTFEVEVDEKDDTPGTTSTALVTIREQDVNEAPTISPATFEVAWNSDHGDSLTQLTGPNPLAGDPDNEDSLRYTISAGNTGPLGSSAFAIDPATGELFVSNTSELSVELKPTYELTIAVTDKGLLRDSEVITVNVIDVPVVDPGVIQGIKYHDLNGNGVRDTDLIVGDQPDVVFVIDVSWSTVIYGSNNLPPGVQENDPKYFLGDVVIGDFNLDHQQPIFNTSRVVTDGANTILDGELAGFSALNQRLIDLGFGDTSTVSIVIFADDQNGDPNDPNDPRDAVRLDMDPLTPGIQDTTTPNTMVNGERVVDLLLKNVVANGFRGLDVTGDSTPEVAPIDFEGGTNFEAPLIEAISILNQLDPSDGQDNVIFLSDGEPNEPDNDGTTAFLNEVDILFNRGTNLRAFGVGDSSDPIPLGDIDYGNSVAGAGNDPPALQFLATHELFEVFNGLQSDRVVFTEPTLDHFEFYLDLNMSGFLDPGEPTAISNQDPPNTTDTTGGFTFSNLAAGTYHLRELPKSGWTQTEPSTPNDYHEVIVVGGQTSNDINFGNIESPVAVLREDTRFVSIAEDASPSTQTITFTVPVSPEAISFTYDDLQFDTDDPNAINDAFELALVDKNGRSVVPTIGFGKDAFFNFTEGGQPILADGVAIVGTSTIAVDISNLSSGQELKLITRLVNNDGLTNGVNDDSDIATQVRLPGGGFQFLSTFPSQLTDAFVESSGLAVVEAENFTGSQAGTNGGENYDWIAIQDVNAAGGTALRADPNAVNYNAQLTTEGARRDYDILFETTGLYYVWVRLKGPTGSDDSVHVGLDGAIASDRGAGMTNTSNDWHWEENADGTRVTVNVTTPGVHTLNLWMRENGTEVDRILLTSDDTYQPDAINSGLGPDESERESNEAQGPPVFPLSPIAADFDVLSDVSAGFDVTYGVTSFNAAENALYAAVTLTNNGRYEVRGDTGPLLIGAKNISQPFVQLINPDGFTSDGMAYYDISRFAFSQSDDRVKSSDVVTGFELQFSNPDNVQFDYELVVLGALNRAPLFVSDPVTEIHIDDPNPYVYDSLAEDPDSDALTYAVVAGPVGLEILDSSTGQVTWGVADIDTAGVGTYEVIIRATDPDGAFDDQPYEINVVDVPNRPPRFTSMPIVDAFADTLYEYDSDATDPDGDTLSYEGQLGAYLKRYTVPVGQSYTGTMGYLVFANDDDADSAAESVFTNIRIYESGQELQAQSLIIDPDQLVGYGGQDLASTVTTELGGTRLKITGNTFQALPFNYSVTPETILEFTFFSNSPGEIHGIGFDNDLALSSDRIFQIYGNGIQDDWGITGPSAPWYSPSWSGGTDFQVNNTTGEVTWTPPSSVIGENVPVLLRVEDRSDGDADQLFDEQSYNIFVHPDPLNHDPIIVSEPSLFYRLPGATTPFFNNAPHVASSDPIAPDGDLQAIDIPNLDPGEVYTETVTITVPVGTPNEAQAADIIFVVDESGSMSGEHAWLANVATALNNELVSRGIGNGALGNQFGLVGFGGSGSNFLPHSHDIDQDADPLLGSAADFATATQTLVTSGGTEDGWAGIEYALREYNFRDGAAANIILVTDEDRDNTDFSTGFELTYQSVLNSLADINAILNVVVSATYEDSGNTEVLGVDSADNVFLPDGNGGYTSGSGSELIRGYGTTVEEYVELAWDTRGATWDLNQLRDSNAANMLGESFTQAFIDVKADEIASQLGIEVVVSPDNPIFTNLTGIQESAQADGLAEFEVQFVGNGQPHAFDLKFVQAGSGNVIASIPVTINAAGYTYDVNATDPDDDFPLFYELVGETHGAIINSNSGILDWNPTVEDSYDFEVRVTDGRGGEDTQNWTVVVGSDSTGNNAPMITSAPATNGKEGRPYRYSVVATDQDNDALNYFLTNNPPAGITIDRTTGVIDWLAPTQGNHTITVSVADGRGGVAEQVYDLTIDPPAIGNRPPRILSTAPTAAVVDVTYRYDVRASDPDGDPLTFDLVLAPDGMTINPDTGVIVWTPDFDQFGEHSILVRVKDPDGELDLQRFDITAVTLNEPPEIVSVPFGPAGVSVEWTYQLEAEDPNGDLIAFTLEAHPPGMIIDNNNVVRWTPTEVGDYRIEILADDGRAGISRQQFILPVTNNAPPAFDSFPDNFVFLGDVYDGTFDVSDPDGDNDLVTATLDPASLSRGMQIVDAGVAQFAVQWTPSLPGDYPIEITIEDPSGAQRILNYTLRAAERITNKPPSIVSVPTGPAFEQQQYTYEIEATDSDPGDDATLVYALDEAPAGASLSVVDGKYVLAWTPTTEGVFTFTVVVTDDDGAKAFQSFDLPVVPEPITNDPPDIRSVPTGPAYVGEIWQYVVEGFDPDGDKLIYRLDQASLDRGMTIIDNVISWQPTAEGNFQVAVSVEDTVGNTGTQTFILPVAILPMQPPLNNLPEITSTPDGPAYVGQQYVYQVTAVDPDAGDTVQFRLDPGTAALGATIDAAGRFTWTPNAAGDFLITIVADDNADDGDGFVSQQFVLPVEAVLPPNDPPVIRSLPPSPGQVDRLYEYQLDAYDPNGDDYVFILDSGPEGMTLDQNGLLRFVPTRLEPIVAKVIVQDEFGYQAIQEFTVPVIQPADLNDPPVITSEPLGPAVADRLYQYQVIAEDPNGDPLEYLLDGESISRGAMIDQNGLLTWTPTEGGTFRMVVTVTDGSAATTQTFDLPVIDNAPPTITSTPSQVYDLQSPTSYTYNITATDPNPEDIATLQFALDPTSQALGMMLVNNDNGTATLTWDPTDEHKKIHRIEITVTDDDGAGVIQRYDLQVFDSNDTNTIPQIDESSRTTIQAGQTYTQQILATDAEDDPIEFILLPGGPVGLTMDDQGFVQWETTVDDIATSPHQFQVKVRDGRSGLESLTAVTFEINVILGPTPNTPPEITSIPTGGVVLGQRFEYLATAIDEDGDAPLIWNLEEGPTGAVIDEQTGLVTWTPTTGQLGDHIFSIVVTDTQGAIDRQRFIAVGRGTGVPPQINSTPDTIVLEQDEYLYKVTATDVDSSLEELQFTLPTKADGAMTIETVADEPGSRLIRWTPGAGSATGSPYSVQVRVEDGAGNFATQSFDIVVTTDATTGGVAPRITSEPLFRVAEGGEYVYDVEATDEDTAQSSLTYSLVVISSDDPALDTKLKFDTTPDTSVLRWTDADVVGSGIHTIRVIVTDPDGHKAFQTYDLEVVSTGAGGNTAPDITPIPTQAITGGELFEYTIDVIDPDLTSGDSLSIDLANLPTTINPIQIDRFGRIRWQSDPSETTLSPVTFDVVVTDSFGESDTESVTINVTADIEAPTVMVQASADRVPQGSQVTFFIDAIDNVDNRNVSELKINVGGTIYDIGPNRQFTLTMDTIGDISFFGTAMDQAGNTGTSPMPYPIVDVFDPSDASPIIQLVSPTNDQVINEIVEVVGTIDDPSDGIGAADNPLVNDVTYTISLVSQDPGANGARIDLGTFQGERGLTAPEPLGARIDPTLYPNGTYLLEITARDGVSAPETVTRFVNIQTDAKLGNFSLSFTDLELPVAGFPLTVSRTYDTFEANQDGELGYGWQLNIANTDLQVDYGNGPSIGFDTFGRNPHRPFVDGTRVTVTLPDGTTEAFTFEAVPNSGFFSIVWDYRPEFYADPGVTSTLTPLDPTVLLYDVRSGNGVWGGNGLETSYSPIDPRFGGGFLLTTAGGIEYVIDGNDGDLLQIADAQGNSLSFTDDGIVSNFGRGVEFERDYARRITAIIDPLGNRVEYTYDVKGDLVEVKDQEGYVTRFVYRTDTPHYLDEVYDPLNRLGAKTVYDDQGRVVQVRNNNGITIDYDFDPVNRTQTITDPIGERTIEKRDEQGNIIERTNHLGGVSTFTYDAENRLTSITNEAGYVTLYSYDPDGNLKSFTTPHASGSSPELYTTTYSYEKINDKFYVSSIASPGGAIQRFEYNSDGQIEKEFDGLGNVFAEFEYGPFGLVSKHTNSEGETTEFFYNEFGDTIRLIDVNHEEITATYDAAGLLETMTTGGETYTYDYDKRGRETLVDLGDGTTLSYTYGYEDDWHTAQGPTIGTIERKLDSNGRFAGWGDDLSVEYDNAGHVSSTTDESGNVINVVRTTDEANSQRVETATFVPTGEETIRRFDHTGRLVSLTDSEGHTTTFSYPSENRVEMTDGRGNTWNVITTSSKVITIDPLGRQTEQIISEYGLPIKSILPDGTQTVTSYHISNLDLEGDETISSYTDRFGRMQEFTYNDDGTLATATDLAGIVYDFAYDTEGDVTITGPTNESISFEFDENGRVDTIVYPNGLSESLVFGDDGYIDLITLASGTTVELDHDNRGNVLTREATLPGQVTPSESATFTYEENLLKTVDDSTGQTVYGYDSYGNLSRIDYPSGASVVYVWNGVGQIESITANSGSGPDYVTQYTYDEAGNLEKVTDPQLGETIFLYDEANRLIKRTLPNGIITDYTYTLVDEIESIVHKDSTNGDAIIASVTYVRPGPGQPIERIIQEDGSYVVLEYDDALRIKKETYYDTLDVAFEELRYSYDLAGNRTETIIEDLVGGTTRTRAFNYDDALTGSAYELLSVLDDDAAFSNEIFTYDDDGRVDTISRDGHNLTLTYDSSDRLLTVNDGLSNIVTYTYDGTGRRVVVNDGVEHELTSAPNQSGLEAPFLISDNNGTLQQGFVYAGELPLFRFDATGNPVYYLNDAMGSVIGLVDDQGGSARFEYDAFGQLRGSSGTLAGLPSALPGDFRFQGGWLDKITGIYNFRAREYDPRVGRFLTMDGANPANLVLTPDLLNPYQFALNNPHLYRDPSGFFTIAGISVSTAISSGLRAINQGAQFVARDEIKSRIFDFAGSVALRVGARVFGGPLPGIDAIREAIEQGPFGSLDTGNNFESYIKGLFRSAADSVGLGGVAENVFFEVPIAVDRTVREGQIFQPGDALANGFTVRESDQDGSTLAFLGGRRPDFVIGPNSPYNQRGKNYTIGDIKLGLSTLYDKYVASSKAADKEQFQAIALYAKRHGYRLTTFVTAVRVSRKTAVSVGDHIFFRKMLQVLGLRNGVQISVFTLVKKDVFLEK